VGKVQGPPLSDCATPPEWRGSLALLRISLAAAAVLLALSAPSASADPVATLPSPVPFAADGGWIAWSAPAPGGGWG
jgi:hypothetical protein